MDLNRLLKECAMVLCLDVPQGTEFGCDLRSWRTGERFKGMKLIPPGIRFLHYSIGHDLKQAMFVRLHAGQVLVLHWSERLEDFQQQRQHDTEQEQRLIAAAKRMEFDSNLGAYQASDFEPWEPLVIHISDKVLQHLNISTGTIISPGDARSVDQDNGKNKGLIMPYFQSQVRTARFSLLPPNIVDYSRNVRRGEQRADDSIPKHFLQLLKVPSQITALGMDPSPLLTALMESEYQGDKAMFLGELQVAFLLFMYISSLDALEQWKKMVDLFCKSLGFQEANPEFACKVISCIKSQLILAPKDLFTDELLCDNALSGALSYLLFADIHRSLALENQVKQFTSFLSKRFGSGIVQSMKETYETQNG